MRSAGGKLWLAIASRVVMLGVVTWLPSNSAVAGSAGEARFIRGDSNHNGQVDVSDAVHALGFLFLGGKAPVCPDATDANDDGKLDIADPVYVLGFLFLGKGQPPAPFPALGTDPSEDTLGECPPEPIWMGRPDGCKQCQECQAPDLDVVVTELEAIGIEVLESRWGHEIACQACDVCPSGRLYLMLVSPADLPALEARGWRRILGP